MTYNETIEYLYMQLPVYHRIGKAAYKSDLDNTIALDNYFSNPHKKFRSVHIAGTNGKGSVSHMLASVLQEAGYKTGLYTSPHLKDYRERIRINGRMIGEEDVVEFISDNREFIEKLKPSFFELSVAMAFVYFAKHKVEVAVIETGLGGRLDSTNVIEPVLSVITNIGYDHMDLLGNSLEKIASEKAGIIKNGVEVIIGESSPETDHVFVSRASALSSGITFADKICKCELHTVDSLSGLRPYQLRILPDKHEINGDIPLGGDYQKKNIQTVFAGFLILQNKLKLDEHNLVNGIRNVILNTGLQGRWQILGKNPLVICDTGHNKDGLEYVLRQLKSEERKLHLIIGFVNDKDLSGILPLFPPDASYYFTKASVQRALDEKVLKLEAEKFGLTGKAYSSVAEALADAKENAAVEDIIFIGGSNFIVAEVL